MNNGQNKSWWHTLPGVLTAIAAVFTAITGLIVALNQAGFFNSDSNPIPPAPRASTKTTTEINTIEDWLKQ